MAGYKERGPIRAKSIDAAAEKALTLYPDPLMHVLVDRTDDPHVFRVRTKGGTKGGAK
jgi:hypothetical protein